MIAVNEIFGPTYQGEGKSIGMPCFFLRLVGCNQACVFCDTPYTWDWTGKNGVKYDPRKESHKMDTADVLEKLAQMQYENPSALIRSLVISGGEPMLQQKALSPLVRKLKSEHWWVEVETAGTIPSESQFYVDQYNVSLKLKNSGNPLQLRRKAQVIAAFARDTRANFKFVVTQQEDMDEIDMIVREHCISPSRVYVMPEGTSTQNIQEHAQAVASVALQRGYTMTTRLQILLYGNKRGI